MYERAYVYPNTDGSFGYRIDSKTDLTSRSVIEKVYTAKVKKTEVSAIPVKTLTVAPTPTAISTTVETTTVTTTTTIYPAPKIKNVEPSSGKTGTTVSVTIDGQNFVSGANVTMRKTGETSIPATDVSVTSTVITCKFVIPAGASIGNWEMVVTNPDKQYHLFQNAILVQEGTATVTTTTTPYSAASGLVKITQVNDPRLVTGGNEEPKTVSILGTNLTAASNMKLTGPTTITSTNYACSSSTAAIGYFTIPSGNLGTYYVNVVDSSGNILATSTTTLEITNT
jgi:hypothetical protein